jgi:hypothetical protein
MAAVEKKAADQREQAERYAEYRSQIHTFRPTPFV